MLSLRTREREGRRSPTTGIERANHPRVPHGLHVCVQRAHEGYAGHQSCDHTKVKDERMHIACVVPRKDGFVDFIAKRVLAFLDELKSFANSPVLFKTDQEPSFVDFMIKLKGLRAGITTFLLAPRRPTTAWKGGPCPGGHDPSLERCARSQVVCQTRFETQDHLLDRRVRSSSVEQVRGGSRWQDKLRTW